MNIRKGIHRHGSTPQSKAIRYLDEAVSILVRQHYEQLGCFTCGRLIPWKEADCGHFRRRECMSTRFDLRNLGLQCKKCNRFDGGRSYEFGKKLDQVWGIRTADLMELRSYRTVQWEVKELEQLRGAAKHSWLAYLTLYAELIAPKLLQRVAIIARNKK